jgi:stringent starvation protein B
MKSMFLIFIITTSFSPFILASAPNSGASVPSASIRDLALVAWTAADNADRSYRMSNIQKEYKAKQRREDSCCCCQ